MRKKCIHRFSIIKENKAFHKDWMRGGVGKLLRKGWFLQECGEESRVQSVMLNIFVDDISVCAEQVVSGRHCGTKGKRPELSVAKGGKEVKI